MARSDALFLGGADTSAERAGSLCGRADVGRRGAPDMSLVRRGSRRHSIERRIASCERRIRSIDDRWTAGMSRSTELADRATDLAERAIELAARQAFECQLRQARSALQRACQGQGDICEGCGALIDQARLEAVPGTTMCIECQEESERNRL